MAQTPNSYQQGAGVARTGTAIDEGLRSYMLGVYNYMAAGIAVTGLVAYALFAMAVTTDPGTGAKALTSLGAVLYTSPLRWVLMFAPLAFVIFFSVRANSMSLSAVQTLFWVFSALMGASLSIIFLVYAGTSIARVFFVTAAAFAALSIYGYTTKKDLTGWGSFLFMGVVGIIIAAIVNLIFLQSSAVQFAVSSLAVLIFAGLTAYDTQRIKDDYYAYAGTGEMAARASIYGALSLYLDFINMFVNLLYLFGDSE